MHEDKITYCLDILCFIVAVMVVINVSIIITNAFKGSFKDGLRKWSSSGCTRGFLNEPLPTCAY